MIDKVSSWLVNRVSNSSFQNFLKDSLVELCSIETIPTNNLHNMVNNEQQVFNLIINMMEEYCPECIQYEKLIDENLKNNSTFTRPYYTESSSPYDNRKNLLCIWTPYQEGLKGNSIGLNAHIDTVPPHIAPFIDGNLVFGRGAIDDKGGCLNIIASLRLLNEIGEVFGIYPGKKITSMFVIDEETGGNGSLSLALDKDLMKTIDTMVITEPTSQQIHPANRGALWYKIELPVKDKSRAILIMLKVVFALEEAGRTLRAESEHILFPEKPVQTCQGIIGPYGEHPSRICDRIEFVITSKLTFVEMNKLVNEGLDEYKRVYGIKISHNPPYTLKLETGIFKLELKGTSGHMGASLELDNAVVKASYIMERIYKIDKKLKIDFRDNSKTESLILEGGQGFLPSHSLIDVENIIKNTVISTVSELNGRHNTPVKIGFDKLHNDSFSGDPESKSIGHAVFAAEKLGIHVKMPLSGFPVSCDARLFAKIAEKETLTVGPGKLEDAHSNLEKMNINELAFSSAFLALFILIETQALVLAESR